MSRPCDRDTEKAPLLGCPNQHQRPTVCFDENYTVEFLALGFVHADELLAKAELARTIRGLIERQNLTQTEAARLLGTTQPKVSDLFRGRLDGFSMERLYRFLNALGQDVQIVVRPKPRLRERATIRAHVKPRRSVIHEG